MASNIAELREELREVVRGGKVVPEHIAYFENAEYGIEAIVEARGEKVAVIFRDTDADETVEVRLFPADARDNAVDYAKTLCKE